MGKGRRVGGVPSQRQGEQGGQRVWREVGGSEERRHRVHGASGREREGQQEAGGMKREEQ